MSLSDRILSWLRSIDAASPSLLDCPERETLSADALSVSRNQRPSKRARLDLTPSLSNPPPTTSSQRGSVQKRATISRNSQTRLPPTSTRRARRASPSRPTSPKRTSSPPKRSFLELLEKPVREQGLNSDNLPRDVKAVYLGVTAARWKERVVPREVREQFRSIEGHESARPHFFRDDETPDALATLDRLLEIREDADLATRHEYDEAAWNTMVHLPVLKTVFSSRLPKKRPQARVVHCTSAAISPLYRPIREDPDFSGAAILGDGMTAVSLEESSVAPEDAVSQTASSVVTAGAAATEVIRNTGLKKVDFALCLEAPEGTPVAQRLRQVSHAQIYDTNLLPPVNQTLYGALATGPIAVSIETKLVTNSKDPVVQLGVWIAAWHKRMNIHRDFLRSVQLVPDHVPVPSALLISVVNHDWKLYYACDGGETINLHGPTDIGSTSSLTVIYGLIAALTAIRQWIESDFRRSIEDWFLYEADPAELEDRETL